MDLKDIESNALSLPESDRALLAAHLLDSLPGVLMEADEGVAEAKRRRAEMESSPSASMTWEEIRSGLDR